MIIQHLLEASTYEGAVGTWDEVSTEYLEDLEIDNPRLWELHEKVKEGGFYEEFDTKVIKLVEELSIEIFNQINKPVISLTEDQVNGLVAHLMDSALIAEALEDNVILEFLPRQGISVGFCSENESEWGNIELIALKSTAVANLSKLVKEHVIGKESVYFYVCRDNSEVLLESFTEEEGEQADEGGSYERYGDTEIYIGYDN